MQLPVDATDSMQMDLCQSLLPAGFVGTVQTVDTIIETGFGRVLHCRRERKKA